MGINLMKDKLILPKQEIFYSPIQPINWFYTPFLPKPNGFQNRIFPEIFLEIQE